MSSKYKYQIGTEKDKKHILIGNVPQKQKYLGFKINQTRLTEQRITIRIFGDILRRIPAKIKDSRSVLPYLTASAALEGCSTAWCRFLTASMGIMTAQASTPAEPPDRNVFQNQDRSEKTWGKEAEAGFFIRYLGKSTGCLGHRTVATCGVAV